MSLLYSRYWYKCLILCVLYLSVVFFYVPDDFSILTYEALYRISPMLDQMIDGMKASNVMEMFTHFAEICAPLLTYSGEIAPEAVSTAIYVDEESMVMQPGDEILLVFLYRFIQNATGSGMSA